jgi:hypothetical protein
MGVQSLVEVEVAVAGRWQEVQEVQGALEAEAVRRKTVRRADHPHSCPLCECDDSIYQTFWKNQVQGSRQRTVTAKA